MSDTAQLDASTAAAPSQGESSAPSTPQNNGVGAPPSLPTGNASETGAPASVQVTPPASSQPADKSETPPASLTNPKSVASTAPAQAAPEQQDPEALNERREASRWGRERQRMTMEMERMRSQLVELQQFREENKRKAEQANLKRWDHTHPETSKFQNLLDRRQHARDRFYKAQRLQMPEGLTPEQQAAVRQQVEGLVTGEFSEDENKELEEFDRYHRDALHGLATNLPGTIGKVVMPMIKSQMREFMQEMRSQREVQRDMEDPELKPLFDRYGDEMQKAVASGMDYDQAVHQARVYGRYEKALEENARLKQQMAEMSGKVSAAAVQQDLAKGKASITRDVVAPKTSPFLEARKWARENGIDTDSDAFRKKLNDLSR